MALPMIPLEVVKMHLNVAHDLDDDLIEVLAAAAVERTVQEIGLAGHLVGQVSEIGAKACVFEFPVASVGKVERWDAVTAAWVQMAESEWELTGSFDVGFRLSLGACGETPQPRFRVEWEAGFVPVPPWFRVACLFLVGHWYENRSSVVVGAGVSAMEVPMAFGFLTEPHRRIYFA
jgi:hypothetical protein